MSAKRNFTIKYPVVFKRFFFFLAYCFIVLGIVFYGICFIRFGSSEISFIVIFDLIIPIICFSLGRMSVLRRLEVEGDRLTYYNLIGIKRKITFNQIDKLVIKNKHTALIYTKDKKFAAVNSELDKLDNFFRRCEQEEINIQSNDIKPITKWRLYVKSIKGLVVFMSIVGILIVILAIIINVGENGWSDGILYALGEGIFGSLFLILFTVIICLPFSLKGFILINRQEKLLGIHFNGEMKKNNICSESYMDDNWFIDVDLSRVFAFHRKYIIKINKLKKCDSGVGLWEAAIIDINDKVIKIRSSEHTLRDLKEWHQRIS